MLTSSVTTNNSSSSSTSASTSTELLPHQASALLAHKNWKHKDLISQFLSSDYDEAKYMATTLAQSSSAALDQLSSLLAEISSEIHGEVALVVRRVTSLKASLVRIQQALMIPYTKLEAQVTQLEMVHKTSEYIRQTIRVLNLVEKLKRQHQTTPSMTADATSTAASNSIAVPPLRSLIRSATLLDEIQTIFSQINLNGITAIDAQLPYLNSVAEAIQKSGAK